ncbi:MAG TPA: DNA-deoxyinosine glycosylase [Sphingomicrobium sp.]|nr:DNA-deoxyinosine glycosylase [Sphingomicrobium sp.]
MSVKYGLPPIAPGDASLFILGSLPGDASLMTQRYYAHPTNQFWKLVGTAVGEDLQALDYQSKLDRLAEHRIGLWDVVAFAERQGSLDQKIRHAGHNPVERLLDDFPDVRAIAFNGGTAAKIGRKLIGDPHGLTLLDLPSSSAANTRALVDKAKAWSRLAEFVTSAQTDPR